MPLSQTYLALPDWAAAQEPAEWLTDWEQAQWRGLQSHRRRAEWLAGRLAAKRLLQRDFHLAPLSCEIRRTGVAPVVFGTLNTNVILSLSHSGGLGAASWSEGHQEGAVGLDCQRIRPVRGDLAHRILTPSEQSQWASQFGPDKDCAGLLLFWTLKEAAIKARREPWQRSLRDMEVIFLTPPELGAGGQSTAQVSLGGRETIPATYARYENWWIARAVRLMPR